MHCSWFQPCAISAFVARSCLFQMFVVLCLRCAVMNWSFPTFTEEDNPASFHELIYVRSEIKIYYEYIAHKFTLRYVTLLYVTLHFCPFQFFDSFAEQFIPIHCRFLTYMHIASLNLWLTVNPSILSYDWTVNSVPLITTIADSRNLASFILLSVIMAAVVSASLLHKQVLDYIIIIRVEMM